jgi:hypothetical protein
MIEHLGPSTSLLIPRPQLKLVPNQRRILPLSKILHHLNPLSCLAVPLRNIHQCIHHSNATRTPDPPVNDSTSAGLVALSRHSTAPAFESFADALTVHVKHDPETRYISSANKLTKMGFSAKESLHPNSISPQVHEQKLRFGLKSFFKGKTSFLGFARLSLVYCSLCV